MKLLNIITALLLVILISKPSHAYLDDLDGLLKDHLKTVTYSGITYNGVDYDAWKSDKRHVQVRDEILAINPNDLNSNNARLAYWINAYNVLTIDLIIREGERETIKNLGGVISSPWKKHKWTINGQSKTLDSIEHDIIRKIGDARIHFAVNCAAKSCPDLRMESYRAETINEQLDDQVRSAFENETKIYKNDEGDNQIHLTKIMDWYGEDFNDGNLILWLKPYLGNAINDDTSIDFYGYDWSLNKQ